MTIDPSRPDQVSEALIEYLAGRDDLADTSFAEQPEELGGGFDTYIYAFRLQGREVPPAWLGPLVLRLYPAPEQAPKAEREAAVQQFAAERGYPAPAPLAVEAADTPLGLPFMVLERAPGKNMLEHVVGNPLAVTRLLGRLADAHVALHRLTTEGCPLPSEGPLVERKLDRFRVDFQPFLSHQLEEAFSWLEGQKSIVLEEEPSLCHGDFHPLNIMLSEAGDMRVLDWSEAVLGDRHYDVARTLVLLWSAPIAARSLAERLILRASRGFLAGRYFRNYSRQLPIADDRLRYWEALHCFQGAAQVASLHSADSPEDGIRSDVSERLPARLGAELLSHFWSRARG